MPVTDGNESSAHQPTTGDGTSPDPVAPDNSHAPQPPVAPGHRDLPWKATAERRDLWGPTQRPLGGKVHSPANTASIGRPRRRPLVTFGVPVLVGGLIGIGALVLGLGAALAAPLLVAGGALGAGVLAAGGSGLLLRATRPAPSSLLEADVDIAEPTQQTLEKILQATATVRTRTSRLRTAVSEPTAGLALEHVDSLLRRIDALVGSETIQTLRPYAGELTMLDGMATRYLPELVDAAEDTVGFLATFKGSARQEALDNLTSIDDQLTVLGEGLERIEHDVVAGVSHSLEVHSEFLRTRFADQRLSPLIDI